MIKFDKMSIPGIVKSTSLVMPRYASPLINQANLNSQATRPAQVGQMTELFHEYKTQIAKHRISRSTWRNWYLRRFPEAIESATEKIYKQLRKMQVRGLGEHQGKEMKGIIQTWVQDLIIDKTYNGLHLQNEIAKAVAKANKVKYKPSTKEQESKGIDAIIGEQTVSIKPLSYRRKSLKEKISAKIKIYYVKNADGSVTLKR